jgi:hypothetical protein
MLEFLSIRDLCPYRRRCSLYDITSKTCNSSESLTYCGICKEEARGNETRQVHPEKIETFRNMRAFGFPTHPDISEGQY